MMRVLARRAFVSLALFSACARALGRVPYGGTLRLELPFSLDGIDPHRGDDAASALLGPAVADSLYALDSAGRPYPVLAAGLPETTPQGTRVELRPGLATARGRALDGRDVVFSIERARRAAARPLLGKAMAKPVRGAPLAVVVTGASPDELAAALASPLTAIVPTDFVADTPDGTGAFQATRQGDGMVLVRNDRAARGPAYLDRIEVRGAADLGGALRAFESGDADIGWLGGGLHRRRAGAVDFRTEPLGFVVLRTGNAVPGWGAPGIAERLVGAIDPARVSHLGLVPRPNSRSNALWGGPATELLFDGGSAYLGEIAQVVAAALSQPGHELRPLPLPLSELRRRRDSDRYALALDIVRRLDATPRGALLALLAAADPRLAEHPPKVAPENLASVTRTLPLAILGDLTVAGARSEDLHGLEAWELGNVYR